MRRTVLFLALLAAVSCRTRTTHIATRVDPDPGAGPAKSEATTSTPPTISVATPDGEFGARATEAKVQVSDLEEAERAAREQGLIRDAFFPFDAFTLDAEARGALDQTAAWLRARPEVAVGIEGHCDERGTEQYNLALGDRRAAIATDYLVTLGISRDRITTVSYGEERPFERGAGEDAWSQNRRAHVVVARRR